MIGFLPAIARGFRQYCVWRGRATRSEYWFFALFTAIVSIVGEALVVVCLLSGAPAVGETLGGLVIPIICLALVLPSVAVCVRRLHDSDRSGGWWWIGLVPIVGAIILIVLLCKPSTPGPNRYGPPLSGTVEQPVQQTEAIG